jgi:hypothetical protein
LAPGGFGLQSVCLLWWLLVRPELLEIQFGLTNISLTDVQSK